MNNFIRLSKRAEMAIIKVLHVIKSLGRGGAEMLLSETARHHRKGEFEFYCVYFLPWKNQMVPALKDAGVRVECLNAGNNLLIMLRIASLIRFIKRNKIEIIHCHLPWAGILGRFVHIITGIPVIYTEHNKQERYRFLTRRLNLLTMGWNKIILAVSGEVSSSIRRFKGDRIPVKVLQNGVDTHKYALSRSISKVDAKRGLKIDPQGPVIGNVCVFRIQKRLDLWLDSALEIIRVIPNARFVLVGDGPQKEQIINKAHVLGIADFIIMPGLKEDVRPYLASMDVFMISSEFEGLPIALLEAMAMEVPPVATAAGGIPEVIDHGDCGFVVPVHHWQELAEFVLKLIQDPSLQRKMGRAARKKIEEQYSIHRMVAELELVYKQVLG